MATCMTGMFIVHPKDPAFRRVDRDFLIMRNAFDIDPGRASNDYAGADWYENPPGTQAAEWMGGLPEPMQVADAATRYTDPPKSHS